MKVLAVADVDHHRRRVVQRFATLRVLRSGLTRRPVIDRVEGAVRAVTRGDEHTAFRTPSDVGRTHDVTLPEPASALLADLPAGSAGTAGGTGSRGTGPAPGASRSGPPGVSCRCRVADPW